MARDNIILQELRAVDRTPKALRSFGLVMAAAAIILAGIAYWKHREAGPWVLGFGAASVLFTGAALARPGLLKRPHLAWMFLSLCLGWVMSRVVLILLFVLVVIPTNLAGRVFGLSFMQMRRGAEAPSLWVKKPARERKHHENLF